MIETSQFNGMAVKAGYGVAIGVASKTISTSRRTAANVGAARAIRLPSYSLLQKEASCGFAPIPDPRILRPKRPTMLPQMACDQRSAQANAALVVVTRLRCSRSRG